jgi:hypothetical protein
MNLAHAARSNFLLDTVVRDPLPNHGSALCVSCYEALCRTSNESRVGPLRAAAFLPVTGNPEVTSGLVPINASA